MTYREAKKYKVGDKIDPRMPWDYPGVDGLGNLIITDIKCYPKTIIFVCSNGVSYEHKKVNSPILYKGQGLSFGEVLKDAGLKSGCPVTVEVNGEGIGGSHPIATSIK